MNRLAAIALFAAALFFTFHRLGSGSLAPWDESLTAERSREMLASGDWLTPQLGFEPNFQKPPLYYWITATLFRAIGQDEFSVRLTSACFGLGCVVLVFLLGRGAGGPGCGLLCAAALALNPHWMFLTRQGMLDSGMAFGLLGCTWALTRPGPRPGAAGFFLALGCLIKTPLVLAGLVIPAFERLAVRREPGARRDIVIAALVACVAGLWWYLFAVVRWGNAFWQTFFVYNTWMRMTETVEGHANSPTFYPTMILQHAPVCFGLFVVALIVALTCRAIARKHATFLLASVIGLLALVLMASQRASYLLLVYPFMALATGGILCELGKRLPARGAVAASAAVALLLAVGLVRRHVPVIDGAPELKQASLRLAGLAATNGAIVTSEIEIGVIMFYSGRVAYYAPVHPWPGLLARLHDAGGEVFVLGRSHRGKALAEAAGAEELFSEGHYVVWKTKEQAP